ncbi:MAG: DUF2755 family protein, partial [Planctomycetota bacterium]|nr:DUF2755 family protein [Planctomycetota bacterium]
MFLSCPGRARPLQCLFHVPGILSHKGSAMESAAPQVEVGTSFACLFMAVFAIAGLAMFGFWLWMLIDAIQHTPSENNLRLIWILVIVLTG